VQETDAPPLVEQPAPCGKTKAIFPAATPTQKIIDTRTAMKRANKKDEVWRRHNLTHARQDHQSRPNAQRQGQVSKRQNANGKKPQGTLVITSRKPPGIRHQRYVAAMYARDQQGKASLATRWLRGPVLVGIWPALGKLAPAIGSSSASWRRPRPRPPTSAPSTHPPRPWSNAPKTIALKMLRYGHKPNCKHSPRFISAHWPTRIPRMPTSRKRRRSSAERFRQHPCWHGRDTAGPGHWHREGHLRPPPGEGGRKRCSWITSKNATSAFAAKAATA